MRHQVQATVLQGHQVASGRSKVDTTFEEDGGTIRLQISCFKERGLDIDRYFGGDYVCGTLNLSVDPHEVHIAEPKYRFEEVRWTHKFDKPGKPPYVENFFLDDAELVFNGSRYKALLYIPDPSTKPGHFHPPTTIELIAQTIPGIAYGDVVTLAYDLKAINLRTNVPGGAAKS